VVEKRTLGALRARYSTRCGGHIMGTARAHFKPVSNIGLCGLPRRLPTRTEAPLCPSCAHDGLRAHPGERCVLPHGCDDYRQVAVPVNDERCDRQDPAASGSASRSATLITPPTPPGCSWTVAHPGVSPVLAALYRGCCDWTGRLDGWTPARRFCPGGPGRSQAEIVEATDEAAGELGPRFGRFAHT